MADYTNKRGIFSLLDVRERQNAGNWSTRGDVWLSPSPFLVKNLVGFGYIGGGEIGPGPTRTSSVERIDYSNDTATASARGPLGAANDYHGATGNTDFGYFGGGYAGSLLGGTRVDRVDYSNDSATASTKGPIYFPRWSLAATGNASFGYFSGGSGYIEYVNPSVRSIVSRLDYSNDTATGLEKGSLSVATTRHGAAGNANFGYMGGGLPSKSTVSRIDYSNDTATASPKGPLSRNRGWRCSATGNADFAYFGGGLPGPSLVDRIDYSNDTATASIRGPLSAGKYGISATGNRHFGYFMGGGAPGSIIASTVERIDYANDTETALIKGPLSQVREAAAAASAHANALLDPLALSPASAVRDNIVSQGTDFGYVAGGDAGSGPKLSSIDRIDYSNDTATAAPKGKLTASKFSFAATGNASFGYFGGGFDPGASTIERINYSNDTADAATKGQLSTPGVPIQGVAATGNQSFGYFAGGGIPTKSTVDRIDYSNDTATASPKGQLTNSRGRLAGTGNQSFGYFGGGFPGPLSRVDRIDYSNDTVTASPKGPLSVDRYFLVATGNASFGYFAGGESSSNFSTVDRVDYSSDTGTAPSKGPLSAAKKRMGATGNSSFGYFAGGHPGPISTVDRVDYSNDTGTAPSKGPLSAARDYGAATSSRANAIPLKAPGILEVPVSFGAFSVSRPQGTDFGYFAGGYPGPLSSVDRVDYSNDTATAAARGPLTQVSYTASGTGNASFGYFGARRTASSNFTSYVDRIDYSNDTATASPRGPMTAGRYKTAATGNTSFGYFGGGDASPGDNAVSSVDRVDYSNDTATASPKGPLSAAKQQLTATGTQSFGYFSGGISFSPTTVYGVTTIDRIDYSNDTATAAVKGPLDTGRFYTGATGNADFGYFGGGRSYDPSSGGTNYSAVSRIDYSNDTATASPKGPLSSTRYGLAATGNTSFGYFGGGYQPSSPYDLSRVDRIDYSNDTATASPKGPLSVARNVVGSVSSRENAIPAIGTVNYAAGTYATPHFGYFVAGSPGGGDRSVLDRIDYANDTATAVARGPLSLARRALGATSNGSSGYAGGGVIHPSPAVSTVDRFDYVNDFSTTLVKGPLAAATKQLGATGNKNFGYYGGGSTPSGIVSTVHRIDYSNDSATASTKGPLSSARKYLNASATGNQNFGYFAGGSPAPGSFSTVDRIDYSSDTANASPKGHLSVKRRSMSATGNADFGYIIGGYGDGPIYTHSKIERIDYANDTATPVEKGSVSSPRAYTASTGNTNFGYVGGGWPNLESTVSRIDYSNDTAVASTKGPLTSTRFGLAATSARANAFTAIGPSVVANTTTENIPVTVLGYFAGGYLASALASGVNRINYSNDTVTASLRGPLPTNEYGGGAVSSPSHGYFSRTESQSDVYRVDYNNDTATASPKGPLSTQRYYLGSTGNSSFGYFGGGFNPVESTVDRIDYSNDTATASVRGPLSQARMSLAATGNQSFGYMIAGWRDPGQYSAIDRIDYSSDTGTTPSRGQLTNNTQAGAATGNADFGYFGGGSVPGNLPGSGMKSTVERIDYGNDTATASPKGPLNAVRYVLRATGNTSFGYFGGGRNSSYTPISSMDRIDYSNDTATASPKGPIAYAARHMMATSAASNANPQ